MTSHLGKRQRLDSEDGAFGPPLAAPHQHQQSQVQQQQQQHQQQYQQQRAYQYPPSHAQAPPQSRYTTPDEAWKSILALDETYIRETLFHVVVSSISPAEALGKIVNMHAAKVRAGEDERRREGEQIVSFDHHAAAIASALEQEVVDQKVTEIVDEVFELDIRRPIAEITEHASRPRINFATRASGLETLRKVGEAMCINSSSPIGYQIANYSYFTKDDIIGESMKSILNAMTAQERRLMCHSKYEGKEWWEMVKELAKKGAEDSNKFFQKLGGVLEILRASDQEVLGQAAILHRQRQSATPTGARPNSEQSQSPNAAAQAYHAAQSQAQAHQMQQHHAQQQMAQNQAHAQAQAQAHAHQVAQHQAQQSGQPQTQQMAQHQGYHMPQGQMYNPQQARTQAQGYHAQQGQAYQMQPHQQQQAYQQDPRAAAAYQGPGYAQTSSSATYYINGHLVTYGGQPPR